MDDNHKVQVIIETPKGSRNKYSFDPGQRVFALKEVLPAGMAFPYDFGFVPSTKVEDGDATDVLVVMDEPAFAGLLTEVLSHWRHRVSAGQEEKCGAQ